MLVLVVLDWLRSITSRKTGMENSVCLADEPAAAESTSAARGSGRLTALVEHR